MTNHDLQDVETRLRTALRARAEDVVVTPALYERVQLRAARGAWLRRGFVAVGAVAVVLLAVVVAPPLLPDPTPFDVVDMPEESLEREAPTPSTTASERSTVPDGVLELGLVVADGDGALHVADRTVRGPAAVVSVAVSSSWSRDSGTVVAGLADGRIGILDQSARGAGDEFDIVVAAAANGGGVVFSPDDDAVAWLEGSDLHVLPLRGMPDGERVLPLVGDVPADLRIEQWFSGADAQVILASAPGGGVWRIPMDDVGADDAAPTDAASLLPAAADADAVDAALLPDLQIAVLRVPRAGGRPTLTLGGLPVGLDEVRDRTAELVVTGGALTLHDPTTGTGSRRDADSDSVDLVATWDAEGVVAAAPVPRAAVG